MGINIPHFEVSAKEGEPPRPFGRKSIGWLFVYTIIGVTLWICFTHGSDIVDEADAVTFLMINAEILVTTLAVTIGATMIGIQFKAQSYTTIALIEQLTHRHVYGFIGLYVALIIINVATVAISLHETYESIPYYLFLGTVFSMLYLIVYVYQMIYMLQPIQVIQGVIKNMEKDAEKKLTTYAESESNASRKRKLLLLEDDKYRIWQQIMSRAIETDNTTLFDIGLREFFRVYYYVMNTLNKFGDSAGSDRKSLHRFFFLYVREIMMECVRNDRDLCVSIFMKRFSVHKGSIPIRADLTDSNHKNVMFDTWHDVMEQCIFDKKNQMILSGMQAFGSQLEKRIKNNNTLWARTYLHSKLSLLAYLAITEKNSMYQLLYLELIGRWNFPDVDVASLHDFTPVARGSRDINFEYAEYGTRDTSMMYMVSLGPVETWEMIMHYAVKYDWITVFSAGIKGMRSNLMKQNTDKQYKHMVAALSRIMGEVSDERYMSNFLRQNIFMIYDVNIAKIWIHAMNNVVRNHDVETVKYSLEKILELDTYIPDKLRNEINEVLPRLDKQWHMWDRLESIFELYERSHREEFLVSYTDLIYSNIPADGTAWFNVWLDGIQKMIELNNLEIVKTCLHKIKNLNINMSPVLQDDLNDLLDNSTKNSAISTKSIVFFKSLYEYRFLQSFEIRLRRPYYLGNHSKLMIDIITLVENRDAETTKRCLDFIQKFDSEIADQNEGTSLQHRMPEQLQIMLSYLISGLDDNRDVWDDIIPFIESFQHFSLSSFLEPFIVNTSRRVDYNPMLIDNWMNVINMMDRTRNTSVIKKCLTKIYESDDLFIEDAPDTPPGSIRIKMPANDKTKLHNLISDMNNNKNVWDDVIPFFKLFTELSLSRFLHSFVYMTYKPRYMPEPQLVNTWLKVIVSMSGNPNGNFIKYCINEIIELHMKILEDLHTKLLDGLKTKIPSNPVNPVPDDIFNDLLRDPDSAMSKFLLAKMSPELRNMISEYIHIDIPVSINAGIDELLSSYHGSGVTSDQLLEFLDLSKNLSWEAFLEHFINQMYAHEFTFDPRMHSQWMEIIEIMIDNENYSIVGKCLSAIQKYDTGMPDELRNKLDKILEKINDNDMPNTVIPFLHSWHEYLLRRSTHPHSY